MPIDPNDTEAVTDAAVELLVEHQSPSARDMALCACDRWVFRDDYRAHATTCPELRAEAVSRG